MRKICCSCMYGCSVDENVHKIRSIFRKRQPRAKRRKNQKYFVGKINKSRYDQFMTAAKLWLGAWMKTKNKILKDEQFFLAVPALCLYFYNRMVRKSLRKQNEIYNKKTFDLAEAVGTVKLLRVCSVLSRYEKIAKRAAGLIKLNFLLCLGFDRYDS